MKLLSFKVENDLLEGIQFLKSNDDCRFKQLIDIAGVDYPEEEKRFQLVYLFLLYANNLYSICYLYFFHLNQMDFLP